MAAKPKNINWDEMYPEWCAGIVSLSDLSKKYGVSRPAIEKHWDKLGITRDLSAKIKANVVLCEEVKDDFDQQGFIYVIYLDDSANERYYKIGLARVFHSRFKTHQCASPFNICVAMAYFVGNMRKEERDLHRLFASKRIRGEWFKLNGNDLELIAKRSLIGG